MISVSAGRFELMIDGLKGTYDDHWTLNHHHDPIYFTCR